MKIYVTKYALTTGIHVIDGKITEHGSATWGWSFVPKGQYVFTLEEAHLKAEEMRRRKIVTLGNQIEKLKTKKIKVIEFSE